MWTSTLLLVGRRRPRQGPVRVCVCSSVLAGLGGPASRAHFGAPHLFLWPLCLSALLCPLRAGVAPFMVLSLPSPSFPSSPPCPPPFFSSSSARSLLFSLVSGPGRLQPWRFVFLSSPPRLVAGALFFIFLCAPFVSCFLWFPAPGAPGRVVWFIGLPLLGSPCALASFVFPASPLASPWWLLLPPPPSLSRGFRRCRSVLLLFTLSFVVCECMSMHGSFSFPQVLSRSYRISCQKQTCMV